MLFDLYFDIEYIISLIDRKFLLDNYLDAEIRKMLTSITVKGIDSKRYKVSKYIKIRIYLSNKDGKIAFIERELYVVDNLIAKALISIDIMKPEDIILNL